MSSTWLSKAIPIAILFSFRMLGLSMLVPIFSLYGSQLKGATPGLIGIALGAYGLTQALLQIPFGILSDRYGRKPLITLGLILFMIGSLMGALSQSIFGVILARILQGSGAIGSVLIALLADVTRPQDRTKAMAVIGVSIGLSFSLAFVLGPILANHGGLSAIFLATAGFAALGLVFLYTLVPKTTTLGHSTINIRQLKQVFIDPILLSLDASIFFQHFILIATFFALPMILQEQIQLGGLHQTWQFYLPVLLLSFFAMGPLLIWAEKAKRSKQLFLGSIIAIALVELGLAFGLNQLPLLFGFILIFFTAFNCLEANLPSLISKQAPEAHRGAAMGVYSSAQFLGIFVGGTESGFVFKAFGTSGVFLVNGLIALLWFGLMLGRQLQYQADKPASKTN